MVVSNNLDRVEAVRLYDKLSGTKSRHFLGVTRKVRLEFSLFRGYARWFCVEISA
jgi:hypothetical protein